ncbi:hypothetical protein Tco_1506991 [Tanacetum coccineum]
MKIEESLNVTFDETPPPSKTSLLVDDDLDEEEVIKVTEKKNLENDIEDETLEIDEIVNIKESRNHPLENIIGNLNQRTLRIKEFGQFLSNPSNGACSFTNKWSLDDLQYSVPMSGLYQTNPPWPDEIKNYVQEEREGLVTRKCLLSGGNQDHVPTCLCHMLYCVARSERYNLAYFIAKRMEFVTKQPWLILPYDMLLTRLFKYVISESPELLNDRYVLCDLVMYPLTAQQQRNTRKDYGTRKGRSSTSSSSAFGQPSSSHPKDDDNDGNDKGTSRASTPSPTYFVNSLPNDIPQIFSNPPNIDPNIEAFCTRQTEIPTVKQDYSLGFLANIDACDCGLEDVPEARTQADD